MCCRFETGLPVGSLCDEKSRMGYIVDSFGIGWLVRLGGTGFWRIAWLFPRFG